MSLHKIDLDMFWEPGSVKYPTGSLLEVETEEADGGVTVWYPDGVLCIPPRKPEYGVAFSSSQNGVHRRQGEIRISVHVNEILDDDAIQHFLDEEKAGIDG